MQDENSNSNNNPSQSSLAYLLHHTNYMHTYIRRLRTPYSGDPHRLKTPLPDCVAPSGIGFPIHSAAPTLKRIMCLA